MVSQSNPEVDGIQLKIIEEGIKLISAVLEFCIEDNKSKSDFMFL